MHLKFILHLIVSLFFVCCYDFGPSLKLPSIFSDNMILQREADVYIWGESYPSTKVQIISSWGKKSNTISDLYGRWRTKLSTPEAGGPHTISIKSKKSNITINDVLIGEVWLASGQSNMEMPLKGWLPHNPIENSEFEILNAEFPQVRMFHVDDKINDKKKDPNGEKESLIPLVKCYPNLIVIRSLTKLFSIAGLRLGYAISSSKRLKEWQEWRDPWPLNALAIATGKAIMSEQNILQKQIKKVQGWVKEEGAWLHSNLKNFKGIISHPSSTNFQLIESNVSLIKLREDLARKSILLRDCQSFQGLGENWLRIGLQSKSNNRRIMKTINEVVEYID